MKLSQRQRENRGTPCFILSGPYSRSSLPSLCCLMSSLMSGAPVRSHVNPCVFLSSCLNDWMFCVSCWKIKMAKTLSAGSAKLRVEHFGWESSTVGGLLLEKQFFEKGSLQPLSFKANRLVVDPKKILCNRDYCV